MSHPTTSAYSVGTPVEILLTSNVAGRFPELIGKLAVIDVVPTHPSTWFTCTVQLTGHQIKLQNTAMKIVSKSRLQAVAALHAADPLAAAAAAAVAAAGTAAVTATPSFGGRSRSNSVVGSIASFVQGVSVRILATEHVLHRCPHLVGCVGTILEVPVHPITWFKVAFSDGNVATFRPSAFRLAGDGVDDTDDGTCDRYAPLPPKRSARAPSMVYDVDDDAAAGLFVGALVRIREGRLAGTTGEVLRLGNGWVQVRTDHGEVSKRSHELEPCAGGPDGPRSRSGSFAVADRRAHGGRARLHSATFDGTFYPRKQPRAEFTIAMDEDGRVTAAPSSSLCPATESAVTTATATATATTVRRRAESSPGPAVPFLYDLERQGEDCPFPLIDLSARQAKRARLQGLVDREADAVLGRPNLSLWVSRLRRSLCDDDEEEARVGASPAASPVVAEKAEEASDVSEMSLAEAGAGVAVAVAVSEPRTVTFDETDKGGEEVFEEVRGAGGPVPSIERTPSESDWSDDDPVHPTEAVAMAVAMAVVGARTARSDSMAADTDNEDAYSPELAGIAAAAVATDPLPPLELPPAAGWVGAGAGAGWVKGFAPPRGLAAPVPTDFASWTKLVATADGAFGDAI